MIISGFDRVENFVGTEKLLLQAISPFPTMFKKASFPDASKGVIVWERVNWSSLNAFNLDGSKILFDKRSDKTAHHALHMLTHSHTMTPFDAPGKQAF